MNVEGESNSLSSFRLIFVRLWFAEVHERSLLQREQHPRGFSKPLAAPKTG
jgi:hypothetical protein